MEPVAFIFPAIPDGATLTPIDLNWLSCVVLVNVAAEPVVLFDNVPAVATNAGVKGAKTIFVPFP
jgi:hypothetical protein